jgi:hypothetical protein
MARKRMFFTFKEALARGSYDDYPMLPPEIDPQLHLSRNDRTQPFWAVCGKDTMIVQMAGTGRVAFRDASVNYFESDVGDFIYVPAGTAHRIYPDGESVTYRYRARMPGAESMVWYCDACDAELHRSDYDGDSVLLQQAYADGCDAYNASASARTCTACGHVHSPIDLAGFTWREIVLELAADDPAPAFSH